MSDDSLARSIPGNASPRPDAEYDAIIATIAETERGRWFLEEYAHRHRAADTELVLAAIERVERAMQRGGAQESTDAARRDVAAMQAAIAQVRDDISNGREPLGLLLGLTETLELRLRRLAERLAPEGTAPAAEAARQPEPPPGTAASHVAPSPLTLDWTDGGADAAGKPTGEEARGALGQGEAALEAAVTDWSYEPRESARAPDSEPPSAIPSIDFGTTAPPPEAPPLASEGRVSEPAVPEAAAPGPATIELSLTQIEAREYQRRQEEAWNDGGTEEPAGDDGRQEAQAADALAAATHDATADIRDTPAEFDHAIDPTIGIAPAPETNDRHAARFDVTDLADVGDGSQTPSAALADIEDYFAAAAPAPHASHLPSDLLTPSQPPPQQVDEAMFDDDLFDPGQGAGEEVAPAATATPEPATDVMADEAPAPSDTASFEPSEFFATPPGDTTDASTPSVAEFAEPPAGVLDTLMDTEPAALDATAPDATAARPNEHAPSEFPAHEPSWPPSRSSEPLWSEPRPPEPEYEQTSVPSAAAVAGAAPDPDAEGDTLIERLETMRAAIASLLDEVAEKTNRGRGGSG